ncbi:MAG: methyl-accepting chemotaxis protein [Bdellovibrionaceae bacterium]|nr:methyl-accepting chemotaxis protein [Pseudobdellovibrionaceae bacterium]
MKKLSLNQKIWGVIGQLSLGFVVCTCLAVYSAHDAQKALHEITEVNVKRDQMTSEINSTHRTLLISLFEIMVRQDPPTIEANNKRFEKSWATLQKYFAEYKKIGSPEGVAIIQKYEAEYDKFIVLANKVRELASENKNDEALAVLATADEGRDMMRELMIEVNELTAKDLKAVADEAIADAQYSLALNAIVSAVSILMSLIISFFVLRAVSRSISSVVRGLSDSAHQVSSASAQIASASEELSQSATEQAASLEETAASVEQLNSMVAKNSENANSAASTADHSQKRATTGKDTVDKMASSMDAISVSNETIMKQINESNESMAGIVKVIEQIDKKTKVINEIVNKTELLSFNASVEAARAGEHGKGFAVVAEEVGNLARMSGAAAEEIGALLEQSITKVNQVVNDTKTNVEKLVTRSKGTINEGIQVARDCGDVFEEVLHDVNTVSGMATEISSASHEQSRGISEITKAMSQLDQMTQQNAATSEECASAAEELSAQADALKGAVSQLVLTIQGGNGKFAETQIPVAATKVSAAPAKKMPNNVIHLKAKARPSPSAPDFALKKASGDTPDYDSGGFSDV